MRLFKFCTDSDGIEKARKWYNKIQSVYPTSPRIHLGMIEIEKRAVEIDVQRIRAIFDRTLLLHGKDSPGIFVGS